MVELLGKEALRNCTSRRKNNPVRTKILTETQMLRLIGLKLTSRYNAPGVEITFISSARLWQANIRL